MISANRITIEPKYHFSLANYSWLTINQACMFFPGLCKHCIGILMFNKNKTRRKCCISVNQNLKTTSIQWIAWMQTLQYNRGRTFSREIMTSSLFNFLISRYPVSNFVLNNLVHWFTQNKSTLFNSKTKKSLMLIQYPNRGRSKNSSRHDIRVNIIFFNELSSSP